MHNYNFGCYFLSEVFEQKSLTVFVSDVLVRLFRCLYLGLHFPNLDPWRLTPLTPQVQRLKL